MLKLISSNSLRFVFLVLFQVLILNNINLGGYINPFLYILFILLLPLDIPNWVGLLFGFMLGVCVDMLSGTPGMHTSATVFTAFCRPFILQFIAPRDGYEFVSKPILFDQGVSWFFTYSILLILLHHLFLFYVEAFRITEFFHTLMRATFSSAFTFILVILSQFLVFTKKTRE